MTIGPSGGDDTAAIQAAIDMVSRMPLVNGVRGAVLLKPGTYKSASTINIVESGVVLRGSGAGAGGTIIDLTETSHLFLRIRGAGGRTTSGPKVELTDEHVPAGATSFTVGDASAFKVGDAVVIGRPATAPWIAFLGMDKLVRNGGQQTWLNPGFVHSWERTITALAGNRVTVDVPLSDSFDSRYLEPPGGSMQSFMNRGTGGSGHGWAIGWGVAWNCEAPGLLIQQPAGAMNWAIGCKGVPSAPTAAPGVPGAVPNGIFESVNVPVAPKSLYLAELCERLGPQALANIGHK